MYKSTFTTRCCCVYHSLCLSISLHPTSYIVYFMYRAKTLPSVCTYFFLFLDFHFHAIVWCSLSLAYLISREKHRISTSLKCSLLPEGGTRRFAPDTSVWQGQEQPPVTGSLATLINKNIVDYRYRTHH